MTTAPWSGPRGLRGLRGRGVTRPAPGRGARPSRTADPSLPALRPAAWGRAVGSVAGAGMRSARGYVSTCSHKAFAILCVLIVVAAMVASLVFNTARGEGAFHLAEAQSSHRQATETRLSLEAQVDEMSSPEQLGMVPAGTMGYVDPETGAVLGEAEAAPQAPASTADNGAGNGAGGAPADESDTSDEKDDTGEKSDKAEKAEKSDESDTSDEKKSATAKDEPAKKKPAEKKPAKKSDDEPTAKPSQKSTPASD